MDSLRRNWLRQTDPVVQRLEVAISRANSRSKKATLRVVRIYFRKQVRHLRQKVDDRMYFLVQGLKEVT